MSAPPSPRRASFQVTLRMSILALFRRYYWLQSKEVHALLLERNVKVCLRSVQRTLLELEADGWLARHPTTRPVGNSVRRRLNLEHPLVKDLVEPLERQEAHRCKPGSLPLSNSQKRQYPHANHR